MSAKKNSIFSRHNNLLGLSQGNTAPRAKTPTDTAAQEETGRLLNNSAWAYRFLLAIYSPAVALAVKKVNQASQGQVWLSCVRCYQCCFCCVKGVWDGGRFLHDHTSSSPLYIPLLPASHGSQRAPGWCCCITCCPSCSLQMKEGGEGGEDEFGWQGAQAEEASHSHRNDAQVGSAPTCFHKPPGLSQGISLFFFKWRRGVVSNLVNHPLPRRWDSDPPGSQGNSLCFSWPVYQLPQSFLIFLAEATNGLSV